MNHTTIPVTAQGEPIPLVKLGQGRDEMPVPYADKLSEDPGAYQRRIAKELFPGDYHQGSEHESGPLETPQTFAAKLRAAGYQEPVLSKESVQEKIYNSTAPLVELTQEEFNALTGRSLDTSVVSREGFRAGVLSAIAGGVIIACVYLAWGIVAACLFTAVCVGLVAGMVITQEWK